MRLEPSHSALSESRCREESQGRYVPYPSVLEFHYIIKNYLYDVLGEPARKTITGHNLDYYLNILEETRNSTLAEFRKRDDQWLMSVDKNWPWGPTDNYCKWFHVCEHESNHNGQIKLLKNRLPEAKADNG